MKVIALVFVLYAAVPLEAVYEKIQYGSWRLYYGEPSKTAFAVTTKECDEPTYLGLGWFKEGFLPGNIKPGSTELQAAHGGKVVKTDKNVFHFCTYLPNLYSWLPTTSATFDEVKKKCEIVTAGVESENTIYVGRVIQDGKPIVGRIGKSPRELIIPGKNGKEQKLSSYELLTFNCNKC